MLPTGYKLLEWIESTGTQYIDTGFKPNQDTRVVWEGEYNAQTSPTWLFSSRVSYNDRSYGFLTNETKFRSDYNTESNVYIDSSVTKATTVDKNKNVTTVNGAYSATNTYASFAGAYSIYLFANNQAGSATGMAIAKTKLFKIYDNGTLVRDYIPVKRLSDGAIGLLDDVSGTFYGNSGTGEFVAGPEVFEGVLTPEIFEEVRAVYLRWSEVDCDGYRIYRDGELVAETTNTFYADLETDDNETYTYTLIAYRGTAESEPISLEVHTKTGYFLFKPLIQSAFFQ